MLEPTHGTERGTHPHRQRGQETHRIDTQTVPQTHAGHCCTALGTAHSHLQLYRLSVRCQSAPPAVRTRTPTEPLHALSSPLRDCPPTLLTAVIVRSLCDG